MGIIQGSVTPVIVEMEDEKIIQNNFRTLFPDYPTPPTHEFFKKRSGGELDYKSIQSKRIFGFHPMTGKCVVCGEMAEGCSPDCLTQRMRWYKFRN